jgi:probable rRNA maturation factor
MSASGSPTGVESPEVTIVVSDEQTEVAVDVNRWEELAHAVLIAEQRRGELTLTFVDVGEMAELNMEHMGKSGPTDVLSFPLDGLEDLDSVGPVLLGDVVICPAIAAAAAPDHAGTIDDEIALLVVHGILHILGHDHAEPEETQRMRSRELEHLTRLHWRGRTPAGFVHEQPEGFVQQGEAS